jgi:hypothetical protein
MKRVRVRIHPGEADLPRTFEAVTGAAEEYAGVEVLNWNVTEPPAAFLLRVTGDVGRFESVLADDETVEEYELLPVGDEECYCFLTGTGTSDARRLWETFDHGSLMTVPPAEWNADGSYTFTIVGRDADVQSAVDRVPGDVRVEIEAVGNRGVAPESVRDRLTDRQREAVEAAIALGYYETPRAATSEDVADALGCATSTAAEHLRKAESRLVVGLFGE